MPAYYINLTGETWREIRENAKFEYTGHREGHVTDRESCVTPGGTPVVFTTKFEDAFGGYKPGMSESRLSVASRKSVLSVGSDGSVLSIGSAGSILSIGSVGSIASAFSVGSAGSVASLLSAGSLGSVLSAGKRRAILGRPASRAKMAPIAAALVLTGIGLAFARG